MQLSFFPFKLILDWYEKNGRQNLPWRLNQSPYHVWISEIFLQQTQVSRVIPYFENVTHKYPDIKAFSQSNYEEFFPYYEGLGYYSRARNMLKCAKMIQEEYNGIFPQNYKSLTSLPGIGPYTAQAILAFGFDDNILAFDTNIEKIFARYYYGSRFIKLSKEFKAEIQKQFKQTEISGRDINAALMDFSSIIDINEKNNIDWDNYPLLKSKFYQDKASGEHRPEKISTKINKKDAQIIVFIHQDHKEYYSSNADILEPFILAKSSLDHRHYIKDHFKDNFNLSLSVRPAYKKIAGDNGNYFFYHAQIQAGNHEFGIFNKSDKKNWEENFENK